MTPQFAEWCARVRQAVRTRYVRMLEDELVRARAEVARQRAENERLRGEMTALAARAETEIAALRTENRAVINLARRACRRSRPRALSSRRRRCGAVPGRRLPRRARSPPPAPSESRAGWEHALRVQTAKKQQSPCASASKNAATSASDAPPGNANLPIGALFCSARAKTPFERMAFPVRPPRLRSVAVARVFATARVCVPFVVGPEDLPFRSASF